MNQKLFEASYDLTKRSKFKVFYESNKKIIFLALFFIFISIISIIFYLDKKDKKRIYIAENYIEAKIYIDNNNPTKAKEILKSIALSKEDSYSALSLFLILKEDLIVDKKEITEMFDYILKNNKFEKEIRNLIVFKKALFQSNFVNESELIKTTNPLINTNTVWKPHAFLLLGDYFYFNKENIKAKEFYQKVLSLKKFTQRFI